MTPAHGNPQTDDSEQAHMHRCEKEEGGPVFSVNAKVEAIGAKVDKVMLRQAAWNGGGLVLQIIGMAIFGAWLTSKFSPPSQKASESPTLINQAHAAPKGQTP